MQNKEAKELLNKYRNGGCNETELALLESWYLEDTEVAAMQLSMEEIRQAKTQVWATLPVHDAQKSVAQKKVRRLWSSVAIAASIVLCLTAGIILLKTKPNIGRTVFKGETAQIVPGGNNAVLTLADGSKISLNDAENGQLANQSGIVITKTKDGQLVYSISESAAATGDQKLASAHNTITTPRGGQYQVNLPDGSRVWLNAASSLKYPAAFSLNERKVELNGEAYFEVSHDQNRPFKVASNRQVVEVLGTHFNISAYAEDKLEKTTLLAGKVRVKLQQGNAEAVLRPGEQAVLQNQSYKVLEVTTEDAIAWKNNAFVFNNEELGSILDKISRWYDVEVTCPPEMEKMIFTGSVSRNKSITQALRIMELTGTVHFKIEGRRITVMP
ncbi:FecR family protein [Pedobacter gandavensis]|uniref:FecR family protein n=1 Tax=Pedobacter gandavensis TaxID=2679963 RepID=UPI00292FF53F|nr:FecR domain-containing protein [Pedobacter gandavensis]